MKRNLSEQERRDLDRRIAEAEKRTGAQIVLAVIERCDDYPELPWKAFALGASVAGLTVVLLDFLRPGWSSFTAVLLAVVATLGAGAALALLCVNLPGFARLFLDENRAEVEARQYAESLFLSRELFATSRRTGILLLVSLFEHEVVVLPDAGLAIRLGGDALKGIITRMTAHLPSGRVARALEEGLAGLEGALAATAPASSGGNELPDGIVEEEGP
jgi:putative membrane protein